MHILVMTESSHAALACIQSFGRKGHTVSVIADTIRSTHCHSKFVRNIVSLPYDPDLKKYSTHLIDISRRLAVDLVVPTSDRDAHVVAWAKTFSPTDSAFLSSSLESVELVRSRNATITLCNQLGIATPPTVCVDNATNVTEAAKTLGYPLFLKLSGTVASQGVHFVRSSNELQILLGQLAKPAELQLQKPITGDFVDITGFATEGVIMGSFSFKAEYSHSYGGTPPYVTLFENPKLESILSKITSALNWTGGIDIDCLQTESGDLVLLEINPRLSGTIIFPLKLGLDLPSLYLSTLAGEYAGSYATAKKIDANAFISRQEELRFIWLKPIERLIEAIQFRRNNSWVDSMFWDDQPLTRALMVRMLQVAWGHLKQFFSRFKS
jgi:biotin carboxylase